MHYIQKRRLALITTVLGWIFAILALALFGI